jgi:hypothetical protein
VTYSNPDSVNGVTSSTVLAVLQGSVHQGSQKEVNPKEETLIHSFLSASRLPSCKNEIEEGV